MKFMALMRFKPFLAPRRYVFKDPDTGFEYEEKDQKSLIQRIVHYRAQNNLEPLEHLELVLPNYWCGLAENRGNCQLCPPLKKMHRGLYQYIKGGISLVQTLTYPADHTVSQEIADKRAATCIKCVYNVFPDKDLFVKWSDEIAEASVGGKRSKYHEQLGNCEVCTCTLKAKVFYKGDMGLNDEQRKKMQDVGCWQPEESFKEVKNEKETQIARRQGIRRIW